MKKIILSVIAVLSIFVMLPNANAIEKPKVTDHEKVTIYIFRGNGCPHCSDAVDYFYNLGDEYADYFEVKTYETWYNKENKALVEAVAEKLDHDLTGVPFIVVGEKYIGGFGSSSGETLIEYALEYYQDKKYKDVVKEIIKDIDYEVKETSLEEAIQEESSQDQAGSTENNNANQNLSADNGGGKYDAIIIVGIFVVLIGGFAGLIIAGKK